MSTYFLCKSALWRAIMSVSLIRPTRTLENDRDGAKDGTNVALKIKTLWLWYSLKYIIIVIAYIYIVSTLRALDYLIMI